MSAGIELDKVGPFELEPLSQEMSTTSLMTSISVSPKSPPAQIVP